MPKDKSPEKMQKEADLRDRIEAICLEFPRYGYRRITHITYIRIRTGFVYLAAILDAFSRKVIGYAVSMSLDTTITLRALRMAIARRNPGPGIIHHSDQGVQYASTEYVEELQRHRFKVSMARTGNPYENAMMESFFKTLK
jgi:transposase InsO family protein